MQLRQRRGYGLIPSIRQWLHRRHHQSRNLKCSFSHVAYLKRQISPWLIPEMMRENRLYPAIVQQAGSLRHSLQSAVSLSS
ncbi:hypothetical protein DMI70_17610 [Escherichia coli]|nr:hypothetical protein [Escherichia coli]